MLNKSCFINMDKTIITTICLGLVLVTLYLIRSMPVS